MKNLILIVLLLGSMAYAQVPQAISFQGVARDSNGVCRANDTLELSISILDNLTPENSVYSEDHTATTDANGLFAIEIGGGVIISGDFTTIDWTARRWVKIEEGGMELGTVEMLTVPFAFQAVHSVNSDSSAFSTFAAQAMFSDSASTASFAFQADSAFWSESSVFALNGKLTNAAGTEFLNFRRANSSQGVTITGADYPVIRINDPAGDERIRFFSEPTQSGVGVIRLRGSSNSVNVQMGAKSAALPNNGSIGVFDAASVVKAEICVDVNGNGFITAAGANGGIKAFTMPHPKQPNKNIVYASIEGPEAAAYERGTTALINGEAEIRFSEHFELVINPGTLTITTSPWSAEAKGLAVIERTATGFKVKELLGGTGNYQFDWEAKAVRKGHEDFQVIRDKRNYTSPTN